MDSLSYHPLDANNQPVYVCVCVCAREREREPERQRHKETEALTGLELTQPQDPIGSNSKVLVT